MLGQKEIIVQFVSLYIKARGLSFRTDAQTVQYLTLIKLYFFQVHTVTVFGMIYCAGLTLSPEGTLISSVQIISKALTRKV